MTVSGLVATLYLKEELKLRYQSEYMFNTDATAKHLTRKDDADKLVIEIREKAGEEDLKAVKQILSDLFEKINLPEKEGELYKEVKKIFQEELSNLQGLEGRYQEETGYPGRPQIEAYRKFLKELTENPDSSTFFRAVASRRTEFEALHAEAEPVKSFFGAQAEIFKRLTRKHKDYCRNIQFLDGETKAAINEIDSILNMEKPYSQIRQLPILEKKIEVSIQEALSAQKREVRESLDTVLKELEKELSDEKFSDDFKETVLGLFNVIERTLKDAEDCALVQSQLSLINDLRVEAYKQIDLKRQTIREKPPKVPYGEGNDDPEKPDAEQEEKPALPPLPQRTTRVINKISFFKSRKMLESEADIEEYLTQLKEKMLTILMKENIRV
ncbi:hypothetical protein [Methanosarcina barkeri]|nr:hypothetical protein [Methanosarcina barkeri]